MKTFKIEIPKGYEIDKEKSTFENIVFKEVKNELPKTWEDLKEISGFFINGDSSIGISYVKGSKINKNVFATKEQAEASLALAQLSQLREVYRNGWIPDWSDDEFKDCIIFVKDKIETSEARNLVRFLSFQDSETRDLFLENFKDLILIAKPLMS